MNIKKIKLGQLSKKSIGDVEMKHLKGGVYYCDWGPTNDAENKKEKKCSCYCANDTAYYDTSTGISANGDWTRANW